jgi:hypothetical protein
MRTFPRNYKKIVPNLIYINNAQNSSGYIFGYDDDDDDEQHGEEVVDGEVFDKSMLEEDVAIAIEALNAHHDGARHKKSDGKVLLTDTFGVQREVTLDADGEEEGEEEGEEDNIDSGLEDDIAEVEKQLAAQVLDVPTVRPVEEKKANTDTEDLPKKPDAYDKPDGNMTSPTAAISESVDRFLNSFTPTTIASSAAKERHEAAEESNSDADDDSVEYLKQISAQEYDGSPNVLGEEEDEDDNSDGGVEEEEGEEEVGPMGISSFVGADGERFSCFNLKVIFHPFRTGNEMLNFKFSF